MKKVYSSAPKTEIELKFDDQSIILLFNAAAVFRLQEISEETDEEGIASTCAKIIYAGAVENNDGFTLEKAKEIVSNLDIETVTGILNDFIDSMPRIKNKILSEEQKKTMQIFTSSL